MKKALVVAVAALAVALVGSLSFAAQAAAPKTEFVLGSISALDIHMEASGTTESITIDGTAYKLSGATAISKGMNRMSFSDLKPGDKVAIFHVGGDVKRVALGEEFSGNITAKNARNKTITVRQPVPAGAPRGTKPVDKVINVGMAKMMADGQDVTLDKLKTRLDAMINIYEDPDSKMIVTDVVDAKTPAKR
jgi:hypothetical protein